MKTDKFYSSLNILLDNIEGTNLLLEYYADFSKRIFRARDFKNIIGSFYQELRKIYVNQHIEFILWHNHQRLVKFIYNEKSGQVSPVEEFTDTRTIYNYVLEKQQIVLTNNFKRFCENLGVGDGGLTASSWLGMPMVVRGKVLGMVVMWDQNPERYLRLQDKQFMSAVTDIASFAIENIYLYDYISEKNGSFKIFQRMLPAGLNKNSLKNVVNQLLDATLQQHDVQYTGIYLRSQYHNKWRMLDEHFYEDKLSRLGLDLLNRLQLIEDRFFSEPEYLYWHRQFISHSLNPVLKDPFAHYRLNSALLFPFTIQHTYYGVWMLAFRRREDQPSRDEIQLYRFFSYLLVQLIEKKALMEQKNKYEDYMKHLEKMKKVGELASSSAHHLNNILSVILGKSQLLQQKSKDKDVLKDLQMVEQAAADGTKAVYRLQSIQSHQEPVIPHQTLNLNHIIQEVVEIVRPRFEGEAQSRGISYELKLSLGKIDAVMGDASALREIVLNLINNALDAMPHGGQLSIQTTLKDEHVLFFISDTGVGIPEENRDQIFEPFFSTKGEKGNGLGLSITADVIAKHKGKIYVDSIPNKGSIFMVELPAVKKKDMLDVKTTSASDVFIHKVLLVDDESGVRETLGEMLEQDNCEVTLAANAEEAVLKFQKYRCDAVLTDLSMPGINGYELAKKIKAINPGIPVFLITGWNQLDRKFLASNKVIDGIIEKPFNMEQIRQQFNRFREKQHRAGAQAPQ